MMMACQDLEKVKQLNTRLTSASGFCQMLFDIGYEYFRKGDVYTAFNGLKEIGSSGDCLYLGQNLGLLLSTVLKTKTAVQIFN